MDRLYRLFVYIPKKKNKSDIEEVFKKQVDIILNKHGKIFDLLQVCERDNITLSKYGGLKIEKISYIPSQHALLRYNVKNTEKVGIMV